MRILEVAPLVSPIDDRRAQIGGAQAMLADLSGGLARRGHRVTLAAAPGSHVAGTTLADIPIDVTALRPADLGPTAGRRADEPQQRRAFAAVRAWLDAHAAEIDVVHAHAYDAPAFDLLRGAPRPVVHTLHLPPLDRAVVAAALAASDVTFATVSEANARAWREAGARVDRVVPNGVSLEAIPVGPGAGGFLLCAGRIAPEKGVDTALRVAARLGREIVIAGGTYDTAYGARAVAPLLGPAARLLGPLPRAEVLRLMGAAAATLMPVRWDEPFGLVALESLATGTPVVAYARGGLAEIVDPTCGALVAPDDEAAFAQAVAAVGGIDRAACRARASAFPLEAMVAGYEALLAAAAPSA